ncbi:MAG TPA: helix-turn-helix domain-containing protein [Streptosporangiaceae bacterium]
MQELTESAEAWPALPAEVALVLRPQLDQAVTEMIAAIQLGIPEYARPLDATYTGAVSRAVRHSVEHFIERVAHPDASFEAIVAEFRAIGAVEAREGRSLEPLQNAMRLGARVAWRWLCAAAGEPGLDMRVLGRIGEALFVYLDELAAACAAGYQEARAQVAGERDRRRKRLLDLIIVDPPASREEIADLAKAVGWALPRRVALAALEARDDVATGRSLPPEVLVDWNSREPCLLVPDPDDPGRGALIDRVLAGWPAALGPSVPLARASASLRWAREALALGERGVIGGTGAAGTRAAGTRAGGGANGMAGAPGGGQQVIRCEEHMSTLLIFSDEELLRGLCGARLAPLERLRPGQRDRLAETLLAWLQHGANANEVATLVHVHPQTVRYRLRQIDELFGDVLREPDGRFELEIALRGRQLLEASVHAAGPGSGR